MTYICNNNKLNLILSWCGVVAVRVVSFLCSGRRLGGGKAEVSSETLFVRVFYEECRVGGLCEFQPTN